MDYILLTKLSKLIEALEEEPDHQIDLSCFSGNLRRDDTDNSRDCWRISDGNNFKVRGKNFCIDKTKVNRYSIFCVSVLVNTLWIFLMHLLMLFGFVFYHSMVCASEDSCWEAFNGSCCC